jgi:hypothetical protein
MQSKAYAYNDSAMAKNRLAEVKQSTGRQELIEIMLDSYLVLTKKEAGDALEATVTALRTWLLANMTAPPKGIAARMKIPGVGSLTVDWTGYDDRYPDRLRIRFQASKDVREQLRKHNAASIRQWKERHPETAKQVNKRKQSVKTG